MTNNDILRKIRYAFDFNDNKMIQLFKLADYETTREEVSAWMKKPEDPDFKSMHDIKLAIFLNGLIVDKRGKRDGTTPEPEKKLTNNIVFRKLKIALTLNDTDILEILGLMNMKVSKHEISALFRNPNQSQYRLCKDQFLRNFLHGMQLKYRKKEES